jgi:hypothetical protein
VCIGAGHDICQQQRCCTRLACCFKSGQLYCCVTSPNSFVRGIPERVMISGATEPCTSADWVLHVGSVALTVADRGDSPRSWVGQSLLFPSAPAAGDIDTAKEPRLG